MAPPRASPRGPWSKRSSRRLEDSTPRRRGAPRKVSRARAPDPRPSSQPSSPGAVLAPSPARRRPSARSSPPSDVRTAAPSVLAVPPRRRKRTAGSGGEGADARSSTGGRTLQTLPSSDRAHVARAHVRPFGSARPIYCLNLLLHLLLSYIGPYVGPGKRSPRGRRRHPSFLTARTTVQNDGAKRRCKTTARARHPSLTLDRAHVARARETFWLTATDVRPFGSRRRATFSAFWLGGKAARGIAYSYGAGGLSMNL